VANRSPLDFTDTFVRRHLGPTASDIAAMLETVGFDSLDALSDAAVPDDIHLGKPLEIGRERAEAALLRDLKAIASKNEVWRSYIGMGYSGTVVPPIIQRNILENPGWYTQYTPYQAEISQGRLEALLNYQTMVCDLTGLPVANSSLLDEGTAAAEAMHLCQQVNRKNKSGSFFVDAACHPQTIAVVQTRAEPLGIEVVIGDHAAFDFAATPVFGALIQYPDTNGDIHDYTGFTERAHAANTLVVAATDLLALCLLAPPGEWGADVAVGNSQRLGVPFGFGGPHAAFFATRDDYKRQIPGRIVGVSKDSRGLPALRLALQTREQHIRREKATSNICTAQVLLAIMAGAYAVYHGPQGMRAIAQRVGDFTGTLATALKDAGHAVTNERFFDTLRVNPKDRAAVLKKCGEQRINLREFDDGSLGISLDQSLTRSHFSDLLRCFDAEMKEEPVPGAFPAPFARTSEYLTHPVFNSYHAEHEMLRYLYRLQQKDLSLTTSMIPLGSCTMKLNATSEMLPVSWPEFAHIHPFAPASQTKGYREMLSSLEGMLNEITGFHATSLQPNAGSQGEYAGMLVIRAYHKSRGDKHRNVCLIPMSAHGTNPASAVLAGMKVVPVKVCEDHGNIDLDDLRAKAEKHADNLAAIMVTYPSTTGVFEAGIREVCSTVHEFGGQVYLDGANLNAQVGLARPGDYGADVIHINLHKTFCIPHGGGGPGMGPIAVGEHLAPFLPGHPVVEGVGGEQAIGPVSAAPWGSPSILPISWVYIALMGGEGLKKASQVAILNANYMAKRLEEYFPVVYRDEQGLSAHEFILDLRQFKKTTGVDVIDVAKRLMDYGFHAPTVSWPVAGAMMIEPTESESKAELDRLCDALIGIHGELTAIEKGEIDKDNNPIRNAPHTSHVATGNEWNHPYTRETAVFPAPWTRNHKYWPPVGRIDDVYGDRHLVCSCAGMDEYADE
jgi:glycine dehydrogenase